jgi:c-di-GMP-binding flagellar brake protein YcgR
VYIPPAATVEVQVNKPINGGLKAVLPVRAKAKVIWIKQAETGKYKLGLEFVDIEDRHREEIIRNVAEMFKAE